MPARDAYDVLDDLTRAGVHIIVVHGDGLRWRCNPDSPPVRGDLFDDLRTHKAAVIAVLMDVPTGCAVPNVCNQLGICHREIESSACYSAESNRKDGEAA